MHQDYRSSRFSLVVTCVSCAVLSACGDSATSTEADCAILLNPVVTIGPNSGPVGPTTASEVAFSKGLYFVSATFNRGEISVFDSKGDYLRSIGKEGRGPGENMEATKLAILGDTVFVYDGFSQRIQAYHVNGDYLRFVTNLGGYTPFATRQGGGLIVLTDAGTAGPATIRVMGGDNEPTFKFSNESTSTIEEKTGAMIADAGGQSVWIAFRQRYALEQYSYSGKRLNRIAVDDQPWFQRGQYFKEHVEEFDSIARIASLEVDDNGRVMPLILVNRRPRREAGGELREVANPNAHKTVIQVIEPTGRLVAEHVQPESRIVGFADHRHVYTRDELEDGTPVVHVFRMHVVKPNTQEVCQ